MRAAGVGGGTVSDVGFGGRGAKSPRFCLHVFAGAGRLASELATIGIEALGVDTQRLPKQLLGPVLHVQVHAVEAMICELLAAHRLLAAVVSFPQCARGAGGSPHFGFYFQRPPAPSVVLVYLSDVHRHAGYGLRDGQGPGHCPVVPLRRHPDACALPQLESKHPGCHS